MARTEPVRRTAPTSALQPFQLVIRELANAYQAFVAHDVHELRETGLTHAQFDVLATLGNTSGFPMGELSKRTLIAKGTLTGVVDRLERRGLVARSPNPNDRRSLRVALTDDGQRLFEQIFPRHLRKLEKRFEGMPKEEIEELARCLARVRRIFES
jgi:DNA-binding MarR family transcriptional regulator